MEFSLCQLHAFQWIARSLHSLKAIFHICGHVVWDGENVRLSATIIYILLTSVSSHTARKGRILDFPVTKGFNRTWLLYILRGIGCFYVGCELAATISPIFLVGVFVLAEIWLDDNISANAYAQTDMIKYSRSEGGSAGSGQSQSLYRGRMRVLSQKN